LQKYTNIIEAIPNATVHAAIASLSPVKDGKRSKYFDGSLTDATTHIRMVGFSSDQQRKLTPYTLKIVKLSVSSTAR
jgi:hypothetical protein